MQEEHNQERALLAESFRLMWDHFPGPCSLVHKSREVIAANPAARAMGREVGMICSKHGPPELHKGCLASKTLSSHEAQQIQMERDGKKNAVFWLPIDGHDDYYLHFAIGME